MDDLVSTEWLAQQLGSPDLVILDATLFMPGETRDPAAEYADAHIPGARRVRH
jgi:thiosulfate/3-mercaptopyruvate sulfurtransferase